MASPYEDVWALYAGWRDGLGTKHIFLSEVYEEVQECETSAEPSARNRVYLNVANYGGYGSTLVTGATLTDNAGPLGLSTFCR